MPYHYKRNRDKKIFLTMILIGVMIGLILGYYIYSLILEPNIVTKYVYKQSSGNVSSVEINLSAVDRDGNGVVTPLIVEVKPGDGKTLTNIEKLLFWVDTQQSIQIAKDVAGKVAGIDVNKYDITYTVKTDSVLVGGPSAGAALTIATIAALENKDLKPDIMMTGTINLDGTIGEVGGVLEKAQAAKDLGARVFLVPRGQGTQTYYKPEESCVKRSNFLFCTTKYKEVTVNISEDVGISVIEVGNITDALRYIFM